MVTSLFPNDQKEYTIRGYLNHRSGGVSLEFNSSSCLIYRWSKTNKRDKCNDLMAPMAVSSFKSRSLGFTFRASLSDHIKTHCNWIVFVVHASSNELIVAVYVKETQVRGFIRPSYYSAIFISRNPLSHRWMQKCQVEDKIYGDKYTAICKKKHQAGFQLSLRSNHIAPSVIEYCHLSFVHHPPSKDVKIQITTNNSLLFPSVSRNLHVWDVRAEQHWGDNDKTEAISRARWVMAGIGARASVLVLSGDERSGLQRESLME